jgi:hypothetical protein
MVRISLGVGVVLAILAAAVPASAQSRRHDGYPYATNGSYGFHNGYREGIEHGERDARQNRSFDFDHSSDYRRADRGYDRRTGHIEEYRREFRRGYEAGYRDGYSRSGNWSRDRYPNGGYYPNDRYGYPGGGYGYPDGRYGYPGGGYGGRGYVGSAYQYGFNEGYEKGLEDVRDGDRYEPARHKWYREGDRHYKSRYGSREAYKNEYRVGFREGYDRAFREASARYRY